MNVAWASWGVCWEEAGVRHLVFFRIKCKVATAGDEGQLVCAAVAAGVVLTFFFCRCAMVDSSRFGRVLVRGGAQSMVADRPRMAA